MNNPTLENQAFEYFSQGNYTESIPLYEQCIEHNPELTENYHYLGLNYFLLGEEEQAQATWMSLLMTDNPEEIETEIRKLVDFLEQEAIRHLDNNKVAIAKKIHEQILELEPNYSHPRLDFQSLIAQWSAQIPALANARKFDEAIELLQLILQADESLASAWNDLGIMYYNKRQYSIALEAINRAIQLSPAALYFENKALIFKTIGDEIQAIDAYRKAINLDKNKIENYQELGRLLGLFGEWEEAKSTYSASLLVKPNDLNATLGLIESLENLGEDQEIDKILVERYKLFPDEIIWQLKNKLKLPFFYQSKQDLELSRQKFLIGLEEIIAEIKLTNENQKEQALLAILHHTNFYLPYQNLNDVELQKKYSNLVSTIIKANYPQWCQEKRMPPLKTGEKIRIGYISAHLHSHSASSWLLGWLKHTNRQEFEIYCYHIGQGTDILTEEFRASCDFFNHIPGGIPAVCQKILQDNLHILIHTDICMNPHSMPFAAMRLAPVQCNTWGHPITSGLPTIDYYISSELMEPENAQEHYSEQLVRLPNIGLCLPQSQLPELHKTRTDFGLKEDGVIYISCQTLFKYLPQHDYIYPAIAQRVPKAQFIFAELKRPPITELFRQRLQGAFAEYGLNSEEFCLFVPRVNPTDYLNRNVVSDIYLDTLGFSGGNTAIHAVICNLPIVTYAGEFMRGRLAYGIVKMIGVEETIAYSEQEYIDIAVRLGNEPDWRASIIEKIKANQDRLFEDKTCVIALEEFFKQVVRVES